MGLHGKNLITNNMKLLLIILLFPFAAFAQQDTLVIDQKYTPKTGVNYTFTIPEIPVLQQGQEVLKQQVAALPPFSSKNEISGTSYTITDADYGLTLPFTNTCSVTFSTLRNDFFCYVVRMGAGKITFTGAVSASTPLAVRYRQNTIKKIKSTIVIL